MLIVMDFSFCLVPLSGNGGGTERMSKSVEGDSAAVVRVRMLHLCP